MASPMPLEDLTWREDALDWIEQQAAKGAPFTADDLAREMRQPPHPNMVGGVFKIAQGRNLIEFVTYQKSTHKTRRGGVLGVWIGTATAAHNLRKAS